MNMTPKQADKIIKAGVPVTVKNFQFGETFTAIFVSRDRFSITTQDGGLYSRDDLDIIKTVEWDNFDIEEKDFNFRA